YDLNDNITGIENYNGQDGDAREIFNKIHMDYNDLNQVEFVKFSDGSKGYSFAYDSMGNVAAITDTFKNTTSFKYDGINRLQEVKDPLNNRVEAGFTDFGNETILRHYSGEELLRETKVLRDPLGRMKNYAVRTDAVAETYENYEYDQNDDTGVLTVRDPQLNREWKVYRDKQGRVYKETDQPGNVTEYTYDPQGFIIEKKETEKSASGDSKEYITTYTYNNLGKLSSVTDQLSDDPEDPQESVIRFFYDDKGNITGTIDAEGNKISHEYDTFNRRVK
ncbi:MAG: hypothetical protein GY849_24290, partial [Deltaproteobacteria bacterium]|nr:hypothetical protein [Deltaproteobacteria bacterium]